MRLPDDVQKSVVFLGRWKYEDNGSQSFHPEGTGFLVASESTSLPGFSMTYLVTARHVADLVEPDVVVRFNRKDGSADLVEIEGIKWFTHPTDKSVDVAVLPWFPPNEADFNCLPRRNTFLSDEKINSKGIGAGDETYTVGLFNPVIGRQKNRPIVRTGHVAMSPPEQVPVSDWAKPTIEAFLIEMRSLGGLSGSPVFVQRSIEVQPTEGTGRVPLAAGAIFLLGLMHGHWSVPKKSIDYPGDEDSAVMLSSGIAIVVPSMRIAEVIDQPELVRLLSETEKETLSKNPAILDGASPQAVRPEMRPVLEASLSAPPMFRASSLSTTAPDRRGKDGGPPTKADN